MSARASAARALIVATGTVVGAAAVVALNPDRGHEPSLALPSPAASKAPAASTTPAATPSPSPSHSRRSEQPVPGTTRSSQQPAPRPTTSSAAPKPSPTPTKKAQTSSGYRDGTYTGDSVFVNYGDVQVQVTVQGHRIVDLQALALPDRDPRSADISNQAWPYLVQEALAAQSARIAGVGGASYTSYGFAMSLKSALDKAS